MTPEVTHDEVGERQAQIRDFFARYYWMYHGFRNNQRDDLDVLTDFFAVPVTITTAEVHLCLRSPNALKAALRRHIDRLRLQPFERSVPIRTEFRVLNHKAALADVEWARTAERGVEVSRLSALYVLADTDQGWRIVNMVVRGRPPDDVRAGR